MIWAGVVAQLNQTRVNQKLAGTELPYPFFVLLRHFAHDTSRAWTINQLSEAFQTQQPGMSKRVKKLTDHGLLDSRADESDGRVKWFSINQKGSKLLEEHSAEIRALDKSAFADWSQADIEGLQQHLYRLKTYLDENRELG